MQLVAYLHSPSTNPVKFYHRYSAIASKIQATQPRNSEFISMHSGKSNVAKGPSGNTRSAGKHQDFLNKPLTGRAAKRAEKKQQDKADKKSSANELSKIVKRKEQELKKKAKEYFNSK